MTRTGTSTNTAAHYLQYELPDEVMLTIFSYLMEQDLCRVSQVCKRFQAISNDTELWKSLYQQVYEYDLPLFHPAACKFEFVPPDESEYSNPWKESFHQLYRGVHVRPGFQGVKVKGRNLPCFNTVQGALDYLDERKNNNAASAKNNNNGSNSNSSSTNSGSSNNNNGSSTGTCRGHVLPDNVLAVGAGAGGGGRDGNNAPVNYCGTANQASSVDTTPQPLVFVHTGTYRGEFLVIDNDVALIGAAPGNVAESVILEREAESTMMFVEGAKRAYTGHLTLKFTPDVASAVPHHKHYCLEIGDNSSPTIDHCIIRSSSVGTCGFWNLWKYWILGFD